MIETLYPMHEVVGSTCFYIFANLFGLIGNMIVMLGILGIWIIFAIMVVLCGIIVFFYKTKLERLKCETVKITKDS